MNLKIISSQSCELGRRYVVDLDVRGLTISTKEVPYLRQLHLKWVNKLPTWFVIFCLLREVKRMNDRSLLNSALITYSTVLIQEPSWPFLKPLNPNTPDKSRTVRYLTQIIVVLHNSTVFLPLSIVTVSTFPANRKAIASKNKKTVRKMCHHFDSAYLFMKRLFWYLPIVSL